MENFLFGDCSIIIGLGFLLFFWHRKKKAEVFRKGLRVYKKLPDGLYAVNDKDFRELELICLPLEAVEKNGAYNFSKINLTNCEKIIWKIERRFQRYNFSPRLFFQKKGKKIIHLRSRID